MTFTFTSILSNMSDYKLAIQSFNLESSLAEIARLQNSIRHLEKSNDELLDVIHEDESYGSYVDENETVIKQNKLRLAALKDHVKDLKTNLGTATPPVSQPASKEIHLLENAIDELERTNDELLEIAYEDESIGTEIDDNNEKIKENQQKITSIKDRERRLSESANAGIHI